MAAISDDAAIIGALAIVGLYIVYKVGSGASSVASSIGSGISHAVDAVTSAPAAAAASASDSFNAFTAPSAIYNAPTGNSYIDAVLNPTGPVPGSSATPAPNFGISGSTW